MPYAKHSCLAAGDRTGDRDHRQGKEKADEARNRGRGMSETQAIHTHDQRVRVFVSSTMEELAAERRAVRDAVTRLRDRKSVV